MDINELTKAKLLPTFDVGLDWLRPLFNYGSAGHLPKGSQITITGEPGVGKTRLLLQWLNAIASHNKNYDTQFHSFEAKAPMIRAMVEAMGTTSISSYHCNFKDPVFVPEAIYGIDSIDFWAHERYNAPYPTLGMAQYLKTLKEAGITTLLIHHKTSSGNKQSGSSAFLKITDIVIDVKLSKQGKIRVSTSKKNRWPGEKRYVDLIHTSKGLTLPPPTPFENLIKSFNRWFS